MTFDYDEDAECTWCGQYWTNCECNDYEWDDDEWDDEEEDF